MSIEKFKVPEPDGNGSEKPFIIDGVEYRTEPAENSYRVYRRITDIWRDIFGTTPEQKSAWNYLLPQELCRGRKPFAFLLLFIDQPTTSQDSLQFYLSKLDDLGVAKDKIWDWYWRLTKGISGSQDSLNRPTAKGYKNFVVRGLQAPGRISPTEFALIEGILREIKEVLSS